jgi:hypothetical protein
VNGKEGSESAVIEWQKRHPAIESACGPKPPPVAPGFSLAIVSQLGFPVAPAAIVK